MAKKKANPVRKATKKATAKKVMAESKVNHPPTYPPTKTLVKKLPGTFTGTCDLTHFGCVADPSGIISPFKDKISGKQINACKSCHKSMILAGQWVND